jgi:hypothetical protein
MAIRAGLAQAAVAFGLMAAASTAPAATPAANLFYDRAVMTAADGACRLFAPDVAAALAAAKAQARDAALRSGADPASLAAAEARADAAGAAGCRSAGVVAAAQRVRAAFAGYARLDHMDFPGEFASWRADRPPPGDAPQWRASQRARFGWDVMVFGLAGQGQTLTAAASFADGARPYGARLVLRDADATSGPYLDARLADIAGHIPIDGRLPPRTSSRVFEAGQMRPAGADLAPPDMPGAVVFDFPDAAVDALARLDPRESAAIEFLFAGEGPDEVRTAYVEVGDFAAAKAFEAVGRH